MVLLSCLITAFKIMKVIACCAGNRACHVSRWVNLTWEMHESLPLKPCSNSFTLMLHLRSCGPPMGPLFPTTSYYYPQPWLHLKGMFIQLPKNPYPRWCSSSHFGGVSEYPGCVFFFSRLCCLSEHSLKLDLYLTRGVSGSPTMDTCCLGFDL